MRRARGLSKASDDGEGFRCWHWELNITFWPRWNHYNRLVAKQSTTPLSCASDQQIPHQARSRLEHSTIEPLRSRLPPPDCNSVQLLFTLQPQLMHSSWRSCLSVSQADPSTHRPRRPLLPAPPSLSAFSREPCGVDTTISGKSTSRSGLSFSAITTPESPLAATACLPSVFARPSPFFFASPPCCTRLPSLLLLPCPPNPSSNPPLAPGTKLASLCSLSAFCTSPQLAVRWIVSWHSWQRVAVISGLGTAQRMPEEREAAQRWVMVRVRGCPQAWVLPRMNSHIVWCGWVLLTVWIGGLV